jgi:hypothetical protein
MSLELHYVAPPSVTDALGRLGRTEDVRFSPGNRRLAVASFHRNRVVVFDIDIAASAGAPRVALIGGVELSSPALKWPHGVEFIDDETLLVTSRGRDVALFTLPPGKTGVPSHEVIPIAQWPADRTSFLDAPGSVMATRIADDACEVLICDHDGHTVTRHRLDRGAGGALRHSEILLQKCLSIPDGVSVSPNRHPVARVRVMADAVFERGRHNPEEGGPKGLDIDRSSSVLVVTSECQPLAFFDVPALLHLALAGGSAREPGALDLSHELSLMEEIRRMAESATEAHAMQSSLSWRLTAPLRRVRSAFRRRPG